ncbi:MAG: RdgB/HAM1 family non-canonical purine NTP pyrophosphatase [Pseudomonadales bacterium]
MSSEGRPPPANSPGGPARALRRRRQVVLASGNHAKLLELQRLLAPLAMEVVSQKELGVVPIVERGATFIENALLKARNASAQTRLPAIADDSGLAVDALGFAPGIYSARFAGVGADDRANNDKLLRALTQVESGARGASFHCALAYLRSESDPMPLIALGEWRGVIVTAPRGERGFGYDPLFYVEALAATAAELDPETKNRESHRGRATRQLIKLLREAGELALLSSFSQFPSGN